MLELHISYTARSPHPTSKWALYDEKSLPFADMAGVRAYLKAEYYYCKKTVPMYHETTDGKTVKCGRIYCYKGPADISHGDMSTLYYQDWVSLVNVTHDYVAF